MTSPKDVVHPSLFAYPAKKSMRSLAQPRELQPPSSPPRGGFVKLAQRSGMAHLWLCHGRDAGRRAIWTNIESLTFRAWTMDDKWFSKNLIDNVSSLFKLLIVNDTVDGVCQ